MEERSDAAQKCARCSVQIRDGDLVQRDHGDWYHVRCARTLSSEGLPDKPTLVLCVVCRTGIGNVEELVMTGSMPTHVRCRPAQSN